MVELLVVGVLEVGTTNVGPNLLENLRSWSTLAERTSFLVISFPPQMSARPSSSFMTLTFLMDSVGSASSSEDWAARLEGLAGFSS